MSSKTTFLALAANPIYSIPAFSYTCLLFLLCCIFNWSPLVVKNTTGIIRYWQYSAPTEYSILSGFFDALGLPLSTFTPISVYDEPHIMRLRLIPSPFILVDTAQGYEQAGDWYSTAVILCMLLLGGSIYGGVCIWRFMAEKFADEIQAEQVSHFSDAAFEAGLNLFML